MVEASHAADTLSGHLIAVHGSVVDIRFSEGALARHQ